MGQRIRFVDMPYMILTGIGMIKNKNIVWIAYIVSFLVLILFLLFGLILTIFFLQNLLKGFRGLGFLQILYFLIGIYLIYKPAIYVKYLVVNKKNFDKLLNEFIDENKKALVIASILSIVLLFIFYSNIYIEFNHILNIIIYLPIFLLNNLIFIVNIFLLRFKLFFLIPVMELLLPISQVLYLFYVSTFIARFFKDKRK